MGQKVNPVGFRLGINRGWDSVWYAKKKDFGNYLIEDFKIREYIKKNVVNSGVSKVMIERTSNKCYVTIYTSRPGFVIGKKGSDIDKIKNNLSKFTTNEVALNIKEVKKPETNAYLVAENIAQQLVKRIAYRRAMKRAMQSAMRLNAKGIKVMLSGRLAGNEIARTEWLREGSIPSHTLRAEIDYGVVIKAGEVDESATEILRAGRSSPRPVDFDYGEEREAWESVFDDERMVALNRALVGHAPAQRQRIRKTIFGSIDERLLVPATEKRHDFRDLMGEGDEIAVSFDQLLSAISDAAT